LRVLISQATPLVYLFYVEKKGRFLEDINLLFITKKSDQSADEKELARVFTGARRSVAIAERRMLAYPTEMDS
jgi:hypothetical protein